MSQPAIPPPQPVSPLTVHCDRLSNGACQLTFVSPLMTTQVMLPEENAKWLAKKLLENTGRVILST